ncbi:hypothetical protein LPJ53_002698 [Coemansia erecta]|uniref:Peptidase S1 domain-containing protein n=1 Tax=Coemansia erecta TaxID=147472 RepID=A0A9W7Y1H8_9FUNG|nr:hypothetical protein LPJ53_002698 [Coemansia erecta]
MKIPFHAPLLALSLSTASSATAEQQASAGFVANIVSLDPLHMGKKCTGALVTNTTVLTTADCLTTPASTRYPPWLTTVSFNASQYRVRQTLVAAGFRPPSLRHNLGIIELASPVPRSIAQPIRISSAWPGRVHVPGRGSVDVLDGKTCQGVASYEGATQACAGGGVVCRGDEGAPVVGPGPGDAGGWVLAGLVSYATGAPGAEGAWCSRGERVYFEKAAPWADWVARTAGVRRQDIVAAGKASAGSSGSSSSSSVEEAGTAGVDSAGIEAEAEAETGGSQGYAGSGGVTAQAGAALGSNSSVNTSSSTSSGGSRRPLSGRLHGLIALVIALATIR